MNAFNESTWTVDDYCGTTKAAKMLMVSVGTVQKLAEKGELLVWKTEGGHRRIALKSIRSYIDRKKLSNASREKQAAKPRILVVTQDGDMRLCVKRKAFEWGERIDFSFHENPFEAMLNLHALNPQVLLLDERLLACMGGVEWLRSLREHPLYRHLSILVFCDAGCAADLQAIALSHELKLLRKPFDAQWLDGYINALVFNAADHRPV